VCLDGTLIPSTRSSSRSDAGHDVGYSGKHQRHGGNIQVLTGPTGYPEWVSDVEPGSTHDITAARAHALPALYPAAARGLPTLTDKGYVGAGIGIHVPFGGRNLHAGRAGLDGLGDRPPPRPRPQDHPHLPQRPPHLQAAPRWWSAACWGEPLPEVAKDSASTSTCPGCPGTTVQGSLLWP
jgi:hypothetical protein